VEEPRITQKPNLTKTAPQLSYTREGELHTREHLPVVKPRPIIEHKIFKTNPLSGVEILISLKYTMILYTGVKSITQHRANILNYCISLQVVVETIPSPATSSGYCAVHTKVRKIPKQTKQVDMKNMCSSSSPSNR
jgi:hypothetical protein